MGDGTFNLCCQKINAITTNVDALRNKNFWIAIAFVDEEAIDNYAALYKDIVRCAIALENHPKCKRRATCELCDGMRGIRAGLHYKQWVSTILRGL